jgi:drug/metabolite transporter (DMT)-like permease
VTHKKAILFLAIAAVLWSLGGVLIKSVDLHPFVIAGIRSLIAGTVLALINRRLNFIWTKEQWGAGICFTCMTFAFVTATKLTTAANAILLQSTAPIYIVLLSGPLLKEKITRRDLLAVTLVMCGMLVFFLERVSPEHFIGNLVALFSGVTFAGLVLCLRMQKGQSTLESLFLGHALNTLIGVPFVFFGKAPTMHDTWALITLGVVQLGIPYVLYGIAIRHVSALEGSLIPIIEPILNPIWVAIFVNEVPSALSLVGGAIVIGAVAWHSLGIVRKPRAT